MSFDYLVKKDNENIVLRPSVPNSVIYWYGNRWIERTIDSDILMMRITLLLVGCILRTNPFATRRVFFLKPRCLFASTPSSCHNACLDDCTAVVRARTICRSL